MLMRCVGEGSFAELRTQTFIGVDVGYIPKSTGTEWINETREISAMLVGLIRSIEKKLSVDS